jgi:hypothetical protein
MITTKECAMQINVGWMFGRFGITPVDETPTEFHTAENLNDTEIGSFI